MGEGSRAVGAGVCVLLLSTYLAGYLLPGGVAAVGSLGRLSAAGASRLSAYRMLDGERHDAQTLTSGESLPSPVVLEPTHDDPRVRQPSLLAKR